MKILFLGYAVSANACEVLTGASVAGNKMQVNCLQELSKYSDIELTCITVYPVAPFPRDNKLWYTSKRINITDKLTANRISFFNIPVVKQIWQIYSVWNEAKKHIDGDTVVLTFNMFPQVGLPAVWLKRKYGNKIVCLLADLPIDDNSNSTNLVRNWLRRRFNKYTTESIRECDAFIALNKHAVDTYAPGTKYIVMEGGVNADNVEEPTFRKKGIKRIVYSGALTEYSGILIVIEAMKYIKTKEVVLEIYGSGYYIDEIKKRASEQANIKYCGRVSNREMLKIQREAYLLINPRPSNNPIAKVTFPSKMFEYMTSGTPVLTTKLNGLTTDYLHYLYIIDDETPNGFAQAIDTVLKKDEQELKEKAKSAYDFIVNKKNWKEQVRRIHDFLLSEDY